VDDPSLDEEWLWQEEKMFADLSREMAAALAERFFLSDPTFLPEVEDDYHLGFLDSRVWWTLVDQLDESVDLIAVLDIADKLEPLLGMDGIPTELLEAPWRFLVSALEGYLPREPSGRRVDSRRLVKIALQVAQLAQELPDSAQAAIRAWAAVHRDMIHLYEDYEEGDEEEVWPDLWADRDLPAVTGFGMMLSMTVMRWPERAEGLPLPGGFTNPDLYEAVYESWLSLPDSARVTEEGFGEAEALFSQGQLAHVLARLGSLEATDPEQGEAELNLAYARLSRAILWIHSQCRQCPERKDVACQAATHWPERPAPLVDVAGEIASTGRIEGCIRL
jgi:hypothetical protein